jgi:hypothetical protein
MIGPAIILIFNAALRYGICGGLNQTKVKGTKGRHTYVPAGVRVDVAKHSANRKTLKANALRQN